MCNKFVILISFLVLTFSNIHGQSSSRKKQKQAEQKQEKVKKADDKWFEEYVEQNRKRHISNQTKAVKKRMKERQKKADRLNRQNDNSFFRNFFDNRKRKKRYKQAPARCK